MGDLLIQSIALASIAAAAITKFFKDVGETWLRDVEKNRLRERFELWWLKIDDLPPRQLISRVFDKIARGLEVFFGKQLQSKHAFQRCFVISAALLSCTLLMLGFIAKDHSLITPWEKWHRAMEMMKQGYDAASLEESDREVRRMSEKISKTAEQLDTTAGAAIFSVVFYPFLFFGNAVGFYYAVSFLRRLLRALSRIDDLLMAIGLFVFTTLLTLIATTGCIFVVGVVADPALWVIGLGAVHFASLSFKWALWVIFATSFFSWIFATPSLLTLAFVVSSPLMFGIFAVSFALLALRLPKLFHKTTSRVLLLCAEKGPVPILAALLGVLSFGLALVVKLLS